MRKKQRSDLEQETVCPEFSQRVQMPDFPRSIIPKSVMNFGF